MNYRHIYHAGNFADVLKHAVLALVIEHLKQKPAPFRVLDTHAGIGLYDLGSAEAQKTGEWHEGIGRILDAALPAGVGEILAPYLAVVQGENPGGTVTCYPGSPMLARRLMRPGDVLVVNELHPEDHSALAALFARDRQTKVLNVDAWAALKAVLPPKERRGVVLVDPPFEEAGELERMVDGLREAHRRFATGTVLLWYPIKDARAIDAFRQAIAGLGLTKVLAAELRIRSGRDPSVLSGTGLVILNPPYLLDQKLGILLPYLAERLAQGSGGWRLDWLSGEKVTTA